MIEVAEAEKIILTHCLKPKKILIPLGKSINRVLQEDIFADNDLPSFDRVMMDGIAINFSEYNNGRRKFYITGLQAAGIPQLKLKDTSASFEAMTGSVLPEACDTVIQYELLEIDQDAKTAIIKSEEIEKGKNIHFRGTDKKKGDLLIPKGRLISGAEVAIMASVGKANVYVTQNPRIALVSTGSELVEIDQEPLPHQIRRSNIYALQAELVKIGLKSSTFHIDDLKEELKVKIGQIIEDHEVVILSGGVSMGKLDFVPEILEECGVKKLFHKVRQKPGKPFWFGIKGNSKVVFALPGNPVSTFMCFHRYFKPWLFKSLGVEKEKSIKASLTEDFMLKTSLTYFLQVRTSYNQKGHFLAGPLVGMGSGDHANLLEADGFLELPVGKEIYRKGEAFPYFPYRTL